MKILSKKQIENLRKHNENQKAQRELRRQKICTWCSVPFKDTSNRLSQRTCSSKCAREWGVSIRKENGSYENKRFFSKEERENLSKLLKERWASGQMETMTKQTCLEKYGAEHWMKTEAGREHARKIGFENIGKNRIYDCNTAFFQKIDTEQKAYWFGFIAADGCLYKTNIQIGIHEKDVELLIKFREHLQSTHPIKYLKAKSQVFLRIKSKEMFNHLSNNGLMENKTFKMKFPEKDVLPECLVHHFIRGYVDGDGCWTTVLSKNRNTPQKVFKLIGNINFINDVYDILVYNCCLNTNKKELHKNMKNLTITWSGNIQTVRIRNYLYKDATIFLERKREKAYE